MTLVDVVFIGALIILIILVSNELADLWTSFVFWCFDRYFAWKESKVSPEGSDFSGEGPNSESGPTFLE